MTNHSGCGASNGISSAALSRLKQHIYEGKSSAGGASIKDRHLWWQCGWFGQGGLPILYRIVLSLTCIPPNMGIFSQPIG